MSFAPARPPLVMIHGLLGSSGYYGPQRYLPDFDVHTPDLLGYGSKRTVEQGIDLKGQASEIVRILREEVGGPAARPNWSAAWSASKAISP